MENLLQLQDEIECYQKELPQLEKVHNVEVVQEKKRGLIEKKKELKKVQEEFEKKTEEVINHFQLENMSM